ncbi:MAG: hypothetical protein KAT61_03925 [Gammaproteobacteria bacterium]|nr:hypothetical protein [Gammaproteobacteria bacterium]
MKSVSVLNVAHFVPRHDEVLADSDSPLMLCYYRINPFAGALDSIEGSRVSGRQLVIKQYG